MNLMQILTSLGIDSGTEKRSVDVEQLKQDFQRYLKNLPDEDFEDMMHRRLFVNYSNKYPSDTDYGTIKTTLFVEVSALLTFIMSVSGNPERRIRTAEVNHIVSKVLEGRNVDKIIDNVRALKL